MGDDRDKNRQSHYTALWYYADCWGFDTERRLAVCGANPFLVTIISRYFSYRKKGFHEINFMSHNI